MFQYCYCLIICGIIFIIVGGGIPNMKVLNCNEFHRITCYPKRFYNAEDNSVLRYNFERMRVLEWNIQNGKYAFPSGRVQKISTLCYTVIILVIVVTINVVALKSLYNTIIIVTLVIDSKLWHQNLTCLNISCFILLWRLLSCTYTSKYMIVLLHTSYFIFTTTKTFWSICIVIKFIIILNLLDTETIVR